MDTTPPNDGLNGLAPIEPIAAFGTMPNAQHQEAGGFLQGAPYRLAIVEFDDQGRCYDRRQMDAVAAHLDSLVANRTDAIIVAFVHGWKHDARSDDENLSAFRRLLAEIVTYEAESTKRPVLGVFVGWRGLSEFGVGDVIANASFWGRQAAGQRVAIGSVRELFGRLRDYRKALFDEGAPLLIIAGHSFGGMIVYSALAQSLIEAAAAPVASVEPSFADLVLLINPAIEAARYLPIYDLVRSAAVQPHRRPQIPAFICAQAVNDEPVGTWFPVGNAGHRLDQATIGDLERDCVTHALGFVPAFRTHTLDSPAGGNTFVLDPPGLEQPSPFWVVGASKSVIDGHGGIWQDPFLAFLTWVVFRHMDASKGPVLPRPAQAGPAP